MLFDLLIHKRRKGVKEKLPKCLVESKECFIFAPVNNKEDVIMEATKLKSDEKLSLWERAQRLGPTIELVPGFSFDSDSKVKLYD